VCGQNGHPFKKLKYCHVSAKVQLTATKFVMVNYIAIYTVLKVKISNKSKLADEYNFEGC